MGDAFAPVLKEIVDSFNAVIAAMGAETDLQMLQQEKDFENQRYDIQVQALEKQQALIDPLHDPLKYQQVCDQIQDLERQHQQKLTNLDQQAELQRTAIGRQAMAQTSSLWATNISKMLTLQQSFSATVGNLYTGMVSMVGDVLEKIIEKWLTAQMTAFAIKHGWMATEGVANVTSNAAVAASAAYASTAAIPIVGPELAPAAAASALAATMAFAPMASFDTGAWNLSQDQLAMVHSGETIIPAAEAGGWRNVMSLFGDMPNSLPDNLASPLGGGGAGGAGNSPITALASGTGGPATHFHGPVVMGDLRSIDAKSGVDFLSQNQSHLAKLWRGSHRNGAFTKFLNGPAGRRGD